MKAPNKMFAIYLVILSLATKECWSQDEGDGPHLGKFIGKLNSYHHQVSGDVYAADDWTILLVNFNYDGTGDDTFFWAGDSGRPGPQGFIVPDENQKTNVLERYFETTVRLRLPDGKRVSRIKWFSVYDIGTQNAFGDVFLPDDFQPPSPRTLGPLTPLAGSAAVASEPVQVLDARTILIPALRYDGSGGEVYWWCGVGPQPSRKGTKIPDEYGYLEPVPRYNETSVRLTLPGELTVQRISWLSLYDVTSSSSLAAVLLPEELNVPPALSATHTYKSSLPNCKQLHRSYQVSWEVFGNQVTIQLAAQLEEKEYMSFGLSGSTTSSVMLGADVAVAYYDPRLQRGFATDYNITEIAPCVQVLGQWRGVCRDEKVGFLDSNQVFTADRNQGLTVVTYRRTLEAFETIDRSWNVEVPQYVVWAIGALDEAYEPSFHHLYHKTDVTVHLGASNDQNDCFPFSSGTRPAGSAWDTPELFDPSLRVFTASLGPPGGRARGVAARGGAGGAAVPPLVWYINGQIVPDLQMRRGLIYSFKVFGGNNPHSAVLYHPLVITSEPRGGLEQLSEERARSVRVLAGVVSTRRGRLTPTTAGPLCVSRHASDRDRRRDDEFTSFRSYNRTLLWSCASSREAAPAELVVAPNSSWPDLVYYQSFTQAGMGGRIFVVDRHKRTIGKKSDAVSLAPASTVLLHSLTLLLLRVLVNPTNV